MTEQEMCAGCSEPERCGVRRGDECPGDERRALEADAMAEPSPSAMLAGVHITRRRVQSCACRGKHEHRYGYTRDCTVRDCTCDGSDTKPETGLQRATEQQQ